MKHKSGYAERMRLYIDEPTHTREDLSMQLEHYIELYATAYSCLLRLTDAQFPEGEMRRTAQHTKEEMERLQEAFKLRWAKRAP